MNIQLIPFLEDFFTSKQCEIIEMSSEHIQVKLTASLDSVLMNRPFYWHYMKSTNQDGEPMTISFTTNPNHTSNQAEFIQFGSPRIQKILEILKQEHNFTKLYEQIYAENSQPLYPWLLTNIKLSYKGLLLREELFSLGINLVNGMMRVEMMEDLLNKPLGENISDYCHTISPLISLENGYRRIEEVMFNYIKEQDQDWSQLALDQMKQELAMIDYFFERQENKELHQIEREKISQRYQPIVEIQTISGGLIYLSEQFHQNK